MMSNATAGLFQRTSSAGAAPAIAADGSSSPIPQPSPGTGAAANDEPTTAWRTYSTNTAAPMAAAPQTAVVTGDDATAFHQQQAQHQYQNHNDPYSGSGTGSAMLSNRAMTIDRSAMLSSTVLYGGDSRGAGGASTMSQYGAAAHRTNSSAFGCAVGGGGSMNPRYAVGVTSPAYSPPPSPRQAATTASSGAEASSSVDAGYYRQNQLSTDTDKYLHFMSNNREYQQLASNTNGNPMAAAAIAAGARGGGGGGGLADASYYRSLDGGAAANNTFLSTANATIMMAHAAENQQHLHQQQLSSPSPNRNLMGPIAADVSARGVIGGPYGGAGNASTVGDSASAMIRGGIALNPHTSNLPLAQQFAAANAEHRMRSAMMMAPPPPPNGTSSGLNRPPAEFTQTAQTNITGALFDGSHFPMPSATSTTTNANGGGPHVASSTVDYIQNNLTGLRGISTISPHSQQIAHPTQQQQQQYTSVASLAPSPDALHAAALSLRRQEEALNAKELQLKMKEEELARREHAIRQIVLEALDVQGIALVGGSAAAPNVAQALNNLHTNSNGNQQNNGANNNANNNNNTNNGGSNNALFHAPVSVLEEQMIHFRDEFRRQRTQLRQLYEELNVRERELESAAIGIKKFEQKLKMREMELDTRERTLINEEDDMVKDARRHASTITLSSDAMRKKIQMLEAHEQSLEKLVKDIEMREAELKDREESAKGKIIAAKEAEDHVVRTLERAHDLELKAKELAMASDRVRIREETLWSAVNDIANESSVREAKAAEEAAKAREELAYMRKAFDHMQQQQQHQSMLMMSGLNADGTLVAAAVGADGSAASAAGADGLNTTGPVGMRAGSVAAGSGRPIISPPVFRSASASTASPYSATNTASARNIMAELERINVEIRNAVAANNGVPFAQQPPPPPEHSPVN